jgi:hypothetical protein
MSSELQDLGRRLVGAWTTEARHQLLPDEAIAGSSQVEWLAGERFLIYRTHYDHADLPDALAMLGDTAGLQMHYFDTRGVYRLFDLTVTSEGWAIERPKGAEAFAQRMTYRFDDDRMDGTSQLSYDGVTWEDDLEIVYRRSR